MDADARDTPSPPAGGAYGASVSFAPEDSSRKLLELERTLAAKDAIMEPGVMDSLRTYVASGGKPAAAIELQRPGRNGIQEVAIVSNDENGARKILQMVLQPIDRFSIKVVGRLIQ